MTITKAGFGRIVAASSLLFGGLAFWVWTRRRKQQRTPLELDLKSKKLVIYVVTSAEEWEECLPGLLEDVRKTRMLGLDCEWVLKHPVAMLQIASYSHHCALVRLCCMKDSPIPQSLKDLLADRSVIKLGVAVNDDAKKLMRDFGIQVNGCVDLRHSLQRVRGIYKCRSWGLQGLAKGVLNTNLSKDFKIRCGNWEASVLNRKQIDYAAMDAIIAVDIFTHLVVAKITGLDPQLHPQALASVTMEMFSLTTKSLCQGIVDVGYVRVGNETATGVRGVKKTLSDKKATGGAYSARKRPLWDNCELLAPDGQTLCTCDSRKAAWYISKGLGVKVSDDPMVVKLKFEPSGRPKSKRNYYLQAKENICVVCGTSDNYARKFIVPQEYRKYFPLVLKEHTSHDVLLMCPPCHQRSSDSDGILRSQLAHECGAPLNSGENSSVWQDFDLLQVKSAGRALKFNRSKIPASRVQELEKIIYDFYGVPEITEDVVERAADLDVKQHKDNYISHGQRVVDRMAETGGLLEFQARWRQHFVKAMNPQFLPAYWSVDYVPENWGRSSDEGSDGEEWTAEKFLKDRQERDEREQDEEEMDDVEEDEDEEEEEENGDSGLDGSDD